MLKWSSVCIPWVIELGEVTTGTVGSLQVEVQYFISFPSFLTFMPQK